MPDYEQALKFTTYNQESTSCQFSFPDGGKEYRESISNS